MSRRRLLQSTSIAAALATALGAGAAAAQAQSFNFDIPAESLSKALRDYGRATHQQLLFTEDLTAGKTAPPVRGTFDPSEALAHLLAGSKLSAQRTPTGALVVVREGETQRPPVAGGVETPQQVSEVVVTGTHIRGVQGLPTPSLTFTHEAIETSGATSVEDLLSTLPQNTNTISPSAQIATGASSLSNQNVQAVNGISLRGLGPAATLVLVNGQRQPANLYGRVVDVSAFPLSIIDSIEVVTGGRSAVYGSDAVAGVVNLITKRSYEGAETEGYYGGLAHGGQLTQFSQVVGKIFANGGFVFAYDYSNRDSFDIAKTNVPIGPSSLGIVLYHSDIVPNDTRNSQMFSAHLSPIDRVDFFIDETFTKDRNSYRTALALPGVFSQDAENRNDSEQYSISGGSKVHLSNAWDATITGNYGTVNSHEAGYNAGVTAPFASNNVRANLSSLSATVDGSMHIGMLQPKAAVGVDFRAEDFKRTNQLTSTVFNNRSRNVSSVFGEVVLPIGTNVTGEHIIELSVAARYDHYSDFGATSNYQGGATWTVAPGLRLRAAYSTAFRAPDLYTLSAGETAALIDRIDPTSPTGRTTVLEWGGGNPDLKAERANTWTAGFDYNPENIPATLSFSYFNINYRGRIDQPAQGGLVGTELQTPSLFPGLLNRNPSAALTTQIVSNALTGFGFFNRTRTAFSPTTQSILSVVPNLIVFDNRQNNIAVQDDQGLDLQVQSHFRIFSGTGSAGLNGTYYLNLQSRLTPTAPVLGSLNTTGQPARFRVRLNAAWQRAAAGFYVYENYVNAYTDPFSSPTLPVSAWFTTDVVFRFEGDKLQHPGGLKGITLTLNVENLLDRKPPPVRGNVFGLGYDPVNANATGRFVGLRVAKKW